jgi:hypothetical protein
MKFEVVMLSDEKLSVRREGIERWLLSLALPPREMQLELERMLNWITR